MKKYLRVAKNTWDEILTYRLNFVMWRVRTVVWLISAYFLWLAILPEGFSLFGYDQRIIITYILVGAVLSSIVASARSYAIGDEINRGDLSNFLMRPINYFLFWAARDLGDKAINITFSLIELAILLVLLRPPLLIQQDLLYLFLFIFSICIAVILEFFFNFLLGFIGFWSPEVWGPRFLFSIVIGFFSGGLFPLDMLPSPIYTFFQVLPFTYVLFFPLKIYLGQLSIPDVLFGFCVASLWAAILYVLVKFFWGKGLRLYTAQGR